jgi:hypothetical protein
MSETTISGRETDGPGHPRPRGVELCRALAASLRSDIGRAGRTGGRLRPGERVIDGRVYYSAAWLDEAADGERRRRELLLLAQAWSPLLLAA